MRARSSSPLIVFAGSSSMEATAPLPRALAAELELSREQWRAIGRRSTRLEDWTRTEVPRAQQAIVVLITGNDSRPTADLVRTVDASLRRSSPRVVWLPPLPYPPSSPAAGRDRAMREALVGAGVERVDGAIALRADHWGRDGSHLTRAGYQAYAQQVAGELRARIGRSAGPQIGPRATVQSSARSPELAEPHGVIGTMVTSGGRRIALTSTDALWLARAVSGEGGREPDALAITASMLRRLALLQDTARPCPFASLTDLVVGRFASRTPYEGDRGEVALRGYSQPVAVQWRARGTAQQIARRARVRSLPWAAVEEYRRSIVLHALTGRRALADHGAPAAVHFAERATLEQNRARNPDWQIVPVPGAVNVFASTASSRRYREPSIVGRDGRASASSVVSPSVATHRSASGERPPRHNELARGPLIVVASAATAIALIAMLAKK